MIRVNPWVYFFVIGLFIASLTGCGGGQGDGFTGASASLQWDPIVAEAPVSYTVHYGKQSSGGGGSCNYENSVDVSEPYASISGLEFDTEYYFAVSAHYRDDHERHSSCSNEVSKVTSEATPVQIGT
jgi:hypothetical protein